MSESSLSHLPWDWFLFGLLIAVSVMGLWAFYYWWKKDHHTRERFAFKVKVPLPCCSATI